MKSLFATWRTWIVFGLLLSLAGSTRGQVQAFKCELPPFAIKNIPFEMKIWAVDQQGRVDSTYAGTPRVEGLWREVEGKREPLSVIGPFSKGQVVLQDVVIPKAGQQTFALIEGAVRSSFSVRVIPGILSILPPVMAIVLALLARQVILSLAAGVWLGATFIHGYNPLLGFMRTVDTYIIQSLADSSHATIAIFSLSLGGMVGIISRAGGMEGIVRKISRFAQGIRSGQLATWAMGVFIFFDDYANTLVVGNAMRPFTDRMRISREKLSYIVDSTAAPVASVALISTWVGFQVGLIQSAFESLSLKEDPYLTFVQSIPYSFYSLIAIFVVFSIGFLARDFGPMLRAELRSLSTGKVLRDGAQPLMDTQSFQTISKGRDVPLRWTNAMIPILTMIGVSFLGFYYSGRVALGEKAATAHFGEIIGSADSFAALMWGTITGVIVAGVLAISQRILTLSETIEAWLSGVRAMVLAIIILVLAWSIGKICEDLRTADYVVHAAKGLFSPHLLPLLTFVVAALISFATGTSWATMAILTPIVVPMAYKLPVEAQMEPGMAHTILVGTIGAVLSGSVFGDHCSPISDTTIMSSMASAADHIDHVKTQIPYALLAALVACGVGYLPAGYGLNPFLSNALGIVLVLILLVMLGKKLPSAGSTF